MVFACHNIHSPPLLVKISFLPCYSPPQVQAVVHRDGGHVHLLGNNYRENPLEGPGPRGDGLRVDGRRVHAHCDGSIAHPCDLSDL